MMLRRPFSMHPYRYPAQLALFWIATTLLVAVAGAWQPVPLDSHSHIQTTLKTCIKTIPKNKSRHYGLPISASLLSPSIDAATETSSTWHSKLRIATSECLGAASAILLCFAAPAGAVSGGGLDYANMDITGQDFSNGVYKGKDFTQVIAKTTNFRGSNLQGCRFYKAYLVRTDFTGADLRGASLEDTSMDDALLKNAVASGAYFSASIMDAKDLENADFTDAQFPSKTLSLLCSRSDVQGINPITGVDTRESLMCP